MNIAALLNIIERFILAHRLSSHQDNIYKIHRQSDSLLFMAGYFKYSLHPYDVDKQCVQVWSCNDIELCS